MAVQPQVYYYYKQDTNQILAGAAGNGITNVGDMNALITSSKTAVPLTDPLTIAKIKSIGQSISYKSDVVYNSASAGYTGIEGFEIPIQDDQELWVYRGIQPVNTVPSNTPSNAGPGDSNHTQYNAYLHRPYKLYMLTETGSGIGSKPWLPFGAVFNDQTTGAGSSGFPGYYNVKQLGVVSNNNSTLNPALISQSKDSGSFTVFRGQQEVSPWCFTMYSSLGTPPAVGSAWHLFCETSSTANYMQERKPVLEFNSSTNLILQSGQFAANNSSPASTTQIAVSKFGVFFGAQNQIINAVSSSGHFGKPKGKIRFETVGNTRSVTYDVGDIDNTSDPTKTIINVSNGTSTGPWPPSNLTDVSMSMDGPMLVTTLTQQRGAYQNLLPNFSNIKIQNADYTFTASAFDTTSADGTAATGSSEFGLYTSLADYVEYKATVQSVNSGDVTVTYTGSGGVPNFSTCSPGFNISFIAAAGTVSSSGDDGSSTFTLEVISPSESGTPIGDIYSTRISDVYLSLSSSLTNSIDGLYIFNQLPSEDIAVTASMFVNAWTGSDAPDAPKYVDPNAKSSNIETTYSLSPNPPLYGAGEAGDGPTWPTCSINIYKGNYPTSVPKEGDTPLHSETFKDPDIHIAGLAITTSFIIPSESISFQDCLRLSLSVESGSYASESIENSLIVSEYYLEFRNAAELEGGDGRVPTFIDNSFRGTGGFSNAPDCQPTLNNVVQERNNPDIQLIEYNDDPYDPSNFQLILSGTAARSTVPESNYFQDCWINPRYNGSFTSAHKINSVQGLAGGYGLSPVIEYKRAYLAYCDQVTDPYPVVNSKTQFNILYMINPGGDALNPLISPYTAYDVLGTWDEGGLGQVGINQVSGSTQFDALNGFQTTFKVGQQAIPLLYSQTSANTFANAIPIAGNAAQVSGVTSSFIEYDMSSQGSSKVDAYQNAFNVVYYNIAQGIASQVGQIFPQSPGTFNSLQFNFETGSGFAVQRANPVDINGVVELPIITASIGSYSPPANVFGDEYFGNPGEIFFTTDPLGSGSGDLSDDYMIRGTFVIPATTPSAYKKKKFKKKGNKKKTKHVTGRVGTMRFAFESTDSDDLSLGSSQWDREEFTWLSDGSTSGVQEPTMTFYMGDVNGTTNGNTFDAPLSELSDNYGFGSDKIYFYDVESNDTQGWFSANRNESYSDVQYVSYNFAFQSNITLKSDRRYRFRFEGEFDDEPDHQTDEPQINRFNPTYLPENGDGAHGGSPANPIVFQDSFPSQGPYVSMNVIGNQVASSLQSNALNFPYWDFVTGSTATNAFQMGLSNQSVPFVNNSAITDPGANNMAFLAASGSLRITPNNLQTWDGAISQQATVTSNGTFFGFASSTSGKGLIQNCFWGMNASAGGTIQGIALIGSGGSISGGGFIAGDTITFNKIMLDGFFGTANQDLVLTLTDDYIINNQKGTNKIVIRSVDQLGRSLNTFFTNLAAIGAGNDHGELLMEEVGNPNHNMTSSITNVSLNGGQTIATVELYNDATNSGNLGQYNNPFNNSSDNIRIQFTTGSADGTVQLDNTVIELSSSNGNNNYGLGYYQGYLPYTASENLNFPGGFEPQDTAWPLPNVPYAFRVNDEIRFQNDERFSYKIVKVLTPEQNFMINGRNKLQLTVDRPIQSSVDLNFFLIRRYIPAPNAVLVDRVFPYGSLPTIKEFVPSGNNILTYNDASGPSTGAAATGSTTIIETSGSFIEYIKPLLKRDNTPTAILKPEYPVEGIDVAPDEIIRDLRDKKLIT